MKSWLRILLTMLAWASIILVVIQWGMMTFRHVTGGSIDELGWGHGVELWVPHFASLTLAVIPGALLLVALLIEHKLSERGS